MIIIPDLETVVILTPRAASSAIKDAVKTRYPGSFRPYRHMEADGVPLGYDRWRKIGVVRDPVERLWSLWKYLREMDGEPDGRGKWEPAYVAAMRRWAGLPFDEWLVQNETVFTSPYASDGARFFPYFTVRHAMPENRKSQFVYLRPDLGTIIYRFDHVESLAAELDIELLRDNGTDPGAPPALSEVAQDHVGRFFAWDIAVTGDAAPRSIDEIRARLRGCDCPSCRVNGVAAP